MNITEKGVIILTSTGLSSEPIREHAVSYFADLPIRSVAIITTAAEGKENNKYSKLAEAQFKDLGFEIIHFIDLEQKTQVNFFKYSVIYVCGGDVFKLLECAHGASFKETIENLLMRQGIYIGVSAGAMILSPTIQIAEAVDPEPNNVGLSDLTGLNIIRFEVHPHYETEHDEALTEYEKNTSHRVVKLSNSQAMILTDSSEVIVE
jgi:dipeptidase E